MKSNNKVIATILLLMVASGAALQVIYWYEPRGAGGRGAGQLMTAVALVLLAIWVPQYSRALHSTRYNWRFNLFVGLIVIVALAILLWVVYSRYYGPLIESINSGGGA